MRYSLLAAAFAATLLSWPVQAAEKTVVLDIKSANCVLCPPIVRPSLQRVSGVKTVKIDQANQMADFMATIVFDDTTASVSKLMTKHNHRAMWCTTTFLVHLTTPANRRIRSLAV